MDINPMILQALVGNAANSAIPFGQPNPIQTTPSANPLGVNIPPPSGGFRGFMQNFQGAGGINALMGNPMFGAGMGLLSASYDGGNPYQSALAGMLGTTMYKRQQQEYDLKQKEYEAQQQQAEAQQKLMEANRREATKLYQTFKQQAEADGSVDGWEQSILSQLQIAIETGQNLTDVTKQLKQPKKSAFAEKLEILGVDPATLTQEQRVAALGGGVNVNVGTQRPVGVDAINWRMPDGTQPNPMMSVEEIAQAGGNPITPEQRKPPTSEEAGKIAASEDSITMLNRLEELVSTGEVPIGPQADVWRSMRSPQEDAGVSRKLTAEALGKAYPISPQEAEAMAISEKLSTILLQAIRGAQVGPMEQAKFERQLPRLGQPDELFKQNLQLTRKNLEYLTQRRSELRTQAPPPSIARPRAVNPDTGEVLIYNGKEWVPENAQ